MNGRLLLLILTLLWAPHVSAQKLLDLDEVSVDAYNIDGKRSAYQPHLDNKWTHGGAFNLGLRVADYFRWDNRLHFSGTDGKLMDAGWEWLAIMDYFPVQPFYKHHSQHSLDERGSTARFPIENYWGLRFIFLDRRDK